MSAPAACSRVEDGEEIVQVAHQDACERCVGGGVRGSRPHSAEGSREWPLAERARLTEEVVDGRASHQDGEAEVHPREVEGLGSRRELRAKRERERSGSFIRRLLVATAPRAERQVGPSPACREAAPSRGRDPRWTPRTWGSCGSTGSTS